MPAGVLQCSSDTTTHSYRKPKALSSMGLPWLQTPATLQGVEVVPRLAALLTDWLQKQGLPGPHQV